MLYSTLVPVPRQVTAPEFSAYSVSPGSDHEAHGLPALAGTGCVSNHIFDTIYVTFLQVGRQVD